jgi:hypothetical protein
MQNIKKGDPYSLDVLALRKINYSIALYILKNRGWRCKRCGAVAEVGVRFG